MDRIFMIDANDCMKYMPRIGAGQAHLPLIPPVGIVLAAIECRYIGANIKNGAFDCRLCGRC
jgi:hypothetical protein